MGRRTIQGKNFLGQPRTYDFQLMSTLDGLSVFTDLGGSVLLGSPHILKALPEIRQAAAGAMSDGNVSIGSNAANLLQLIPQILTFDRVQSLAAKMLAGANIAIDGDTIIIGADGIAGFPAGDPLEIYAALWHSANANFKKIIDPLRKALGGQGDSTQSSTTEEK